MAASVASRLSHSEPSSTQPHRRVKMSTGPLTQKRNAGLGANCHSASSAASTNTRANDCPDRLATNHASAARELPVRRADASLIRRLPYEAGQGRTMQARSTAEIAERAEKNRQDGASRGARGCTSARSAISAVDLLGCPAHARDPPRCGRTSYVRSLHHFVFQFIPECLVQPREIGPESYGEDVPWSFQIDLPHRADPSRPRTEHHHSI